MLRTNIFLLAGSAVLLSPVAVPTAAAQQATVESDKAGAAGTLEEVVVTARKRAESLQDVPVAVTALDASVLQDAGAVDIRDVAKLAPGLFYRAMSNQLPTLYMRGVGTRSYDAGAESSVGTFLDGVYIGRFGAQLQDLPDVERVEVLRGPQGSLFGRNTIGGALNVITRRPTEEFYARGNLTYGRQPDASSDTFNVDGLISGPLAGDRMLGQIALSRTDVGGSSEIAGMNDVANGTGTETVRGRLVFNATEELTFDLSGDYFNSVDDRYNWVWRANDVKGTRPLVYGYFGAPPAIDPDPYKVSVTPPRSDASREGWGTNLTVDYTGTAISVTSITAYRELQAGYWNDFDATSLDVLTTAADESSSQLSEELRLASVDGGVGTFGGRLDWLAGLYYFRERIDRVDLFAAASDPLSLFTAPTYYYAKVDADSWAAFGQVGVQLAEPLRLDLGLRYSDDKKSGRLSNEGLLAFGFPYDVHNDDKWTSTDPSVSLSYRFNADVMAFAKYSTGFKSGAYQFVAPTADFARVVARPESVESYEIGLRADWLDRRVRTNVNVFQYDYTDMQVPRIEVVNFVASVALSNAGSSTLRGFEVEGGARLGERWEITYAYAYLDATYDKYQFSPTLDFSGNKLVRAPENTLNLALVYSQTLQWGDLRARVGLDYVDSFYFEPDNAKVDGGTKEPSHTTLDASVGLTRGAYSIRLWGTNITGEKVRASVVNVGTPFLLNEMWMPRATYGVTFSAQFE